MIIALFAAALVAQTPHAAVSTGIGNRFGGAGLQLEGGNEAFSVGLGVSGALLSGRALSGALTMKWRADAGWYGFVGLAGWMDLQHRTRLSGGGEELDADRWITLTGGVGWRLALGGGFFADFAAGVPLTVSRDWPQPFDFQPTQTPPVARLGFSVAPLPSVTLGAATGLPPYGWVLPDYSASVGYRFGGPAAHSPPSRLQAAFAAATVADALTLGVLTTTLSFWEVGIPPPPLGLGYPVLLASLLVRPLLVAIAASLAAGGDWLPSVGAVLAAFLSDGLSLVLMVAGALSSHSNPALVRPALMAVGAGVRTVVTPQLAAHYTPAPDLPVVLVRF